MHFTWVSNQAYQNDIINHITVEEEQEMYLYSLVLFGKHCSKDGRGRKSGEAGSTVCFLCLVLSELVVGGSKVNVALGLELTDKANVSFLDALETRPTTSNPGKKAVLGYFAEAAWLPFWHTADVKLACSDAISIGRPEHCSSNKMLQLVYKQLYTTNPSNIIY